MAQALTLEYDFYADSIKALDVVKDAGFMKDAPSIDLAVEVLTELGKIQKSDFVAALTAQGLTRREADRLIETYSKGPHKRWTSEAGFAYNTKLFTLDGFSAGETGTEEGR
jgi:hypothetical protein